MSVRTNATARTGSPGSKDYLGLDVSAWTWQLLAACRTADRSLFFGPSDTGQAKVKAPEEVARIRAAQKVCWSCPVIRECLHHAVNFPEPVGVWGGMSPQARQALRTSVKRIRAARLRRRETRGGRA